MSTVPDLHAVRNGTAEVSSSQFFVKYFVAKKLVQNKIVCVYVRKPL
jgi:hypothetical protein